MGRTPSYSGKRVLVTGARGYIGSELIPALLAHDCEVTAVSRSPAAAAGWGPPARGLLHQEVGDVGAADAWNSWVSGMDVVFHLASQTSHYVADEDPLVDWDRNVAPVYHLYRACRKQHARARVIFPSTASVYGLPEHLPVDEMAPLNPVTVYDVHKLAAEHLLTYHARTADIPGVALRLANVYGPSRGSSKQDRGFLNRVAGMALRSEEIQIYGTGDYLRDYVHVVDVVDALLRAGAAPETHVNARAFNIATGTGTALKDVVRMTIEAAARHTGKRTPTRHVEPAKLSGIDQRQFIGESSAFRKATGWRTTVDLPRGIDSMIAAMTGTA